MGIVRKQAFGNSLISYAGILIGYANVALIFPRLLDAEVFGLTQVLISAMLFSSNLGSFGLQYTTIRYHHIFKLKGVMPNAFFSFIALASVGCILITSLALWVFADPIKAFIAQKRSYFPTIICCSIRCLSLVS